MRKRIRCSRGSIASRIPFPRKSKSSKAGQADVCSAFPSQSFESTHHQLSVRQNESGFRRQIQACVDVEQSAGERAIGELFFDSQNVRQTEMWIRRARQW